MFLLCNSVHAAPQDGGINKHHLSRSSGAQGQDIGDGRSGFQIATKTATFCRNTGSCGFLSKEISLVLLICMFC